MGIGCVVVSLVLVAMTHNCIHFCQVSAKPASAVAKPAPAVSHEVGSPTFQYIAQESLGFPAPRYGSGTVSPPENFDMTWPDGSTPPHYSNTVV